MRKFDTKVQELKYQVLKEVAEAAFEDRLLESIPEIPQRIIPGKKPSMRCCVYKERAILGERVRLAIGTDPQDKPVIEVIDIACDECPVGGYEVSNACRGCIAHRCAEICPKGAISFDAHQKAHIDKSKCVECGMCAKVCPYSAILDHKRPCEIACKANAIHMNEEKITEIDQSKCISCGACAYQCPFGAISDRSYILNVVDLIKQSQQNSQYRLYAIVAPSIASQFADATLGQVIEGIKQLGFYHVVEVALGADQVAYDETKELIEKGFLTSSCCPSFVDYIQKNHPSLIPHISHNPSPMAVIAKHIKETSGPAKVVFIGPCTSKKKEWQREDVRPYVDTVITFEELQALFDARHIDLLSLKEEVLDNASYYGRIFARSGGLSDAVAEAIKEQGLTDFEFKPFKADGIEACKGALLRAEKGLLPENFIEGMACNGGCINGAGCLTHGIKNKSDVDKYGRLAYEKTITEAISVLKQK